MTTLQDIVKIFHEHSYWENIPGGRIKLVNKHKAAKEIWDKNRIVLQYKEL